MDAINSTGSKHYYECVREGGLKFRRTSTLLLVRTECWVDGLVEDPL